MPQYALGADSLPRESVPKGAVAKRTWAASRVYPDATHDYWIFVPAQYTDAEPASVMVFQDGSAYVDPNGQVRAPTVFDNLIHQGEMPVTIGIFINPGWKEVAYDQRAAQYVPRTDAYARFLLDEILPALGADYHLVDHAAGRAICGMSDGGLCAFTVGWERPDAFAKVVSHIGSFTRLHGGSEYPFLIRESRGAPKPLRVFLQDGANDLNLMEGDWPLANLGMASALRFARYDYRFEMGAGGHDLNHGGAIFPDTLRWIWRDYPGVTSAGTAAGLDAVAGKWDVVTNILGTRHHSVLTISALEGALAATLDDDAAGAIDVTAIAFEDGILTYEYVAPPSQSNWGKGPPGTMTAWLKVAGNTFEGVLSGSAGLAIDFSMQGRKEGSDAAR